MIYRNILSCIVVTAVATALCACSESPVAEVDPFVGTGFHGHTYPGAATPFGLVQLSPDTRNRTWDGCSGYHWSDSTIMGFSHTHLGGTGCADLGDFLFTPATGEVVPLRFFHEDETASPGYYRVRFRDAGITAELTATPHMGMHRYSFSGKGDSSLFTSNNDKYGQKVFH